MNKKEEITAAELMAQLQDDPEYLARVEETERSRQEAITAIEEDIANVVAEIKELGVPINSAEEIEEVTDPVVVPVLLKHLCEVDHLDDVRGILISVLGNRAFRVAWQPLLTQFLNEYDTASERLRFEFAAALSVLMSKKTVAEILPIVLDSKFGYDRLVVVQELGRIKLPEVTQVLELLVDDKEVATEAKKALAKHRKVKGVADE
jgi:hypothetical protein